MIESHFLRVINSHIPLFRLNHPRPICTNDVCRSGIKEPHHQTRMEARSVASPLNEATADKTWDKAFGAQSNFLLVSISLVARLGRLAGEKVMED